MLCVCGHCLAAIESREGRLFVRQAEEEDIKNPIIYSDDSFDVFGVCEWCKEESPVDDLFIIGD